MPLALTDKQLHQVMQAAAPMPPGDRDGFMRSVAAVFTSEHPSDNEVIRALCFVLSERGVAVGERYFAVGQTRDGGGNHGSTGPVAAGKGNTREGRSRVQRS
jgi:hypothetical protein